MYTQDELDNHANQLNPNNDAYWESRGYDERPVDWEDLINGDGAYFDDTAYWSYADDPYLD